MSDRRLTSTTGSSGLRTDVSRCRPGVADAGPAGHSTQCWQSVASPPRGDRKRQSHDFHDSAGQCWRCTVCCRCHGDRHRLDAGRTRARRSRDTMQIHRSRRRKLVCHRGDPSSIGPLGRTAAHQESGVASRIRENPRSGARRWSQRVERPPRAYSHRCRLAAAHRGSVRSMTDTVPTVLAPQPDTICTLGVRQRLARAGVATIAEERPRSLLHVPPGAAVTDRPDMDEPPPPPGWRTFEDRQTSSREWWLQHVARWDPHSQSERAALQGAAKRKLLRPRDMLIESALRSGYSLRGAVRWLLSEQARGAIDASWRFTIGIVRHAAKRLAQGSAIPDCAHRACGAPGEMCHGREWVPIRVWRALDPISRLRKLSPWRMRAASMRTKNVVGLCTPPSLSGDPGSRGFTAVLGKEPEGNGIHTETAEYTAVSVTPRPPWHRHHGPFERVVRR